MIASHLHTALCELGDLFLRELEAQVVHGRGDRLTSETFGVLLIDHAANLRSIGKLDDDRSLDSHQLWQPFPHLILGGQFDEQRRAELTRLGNHRVECLQLLHDAFVGNDSLDAQHLLNLVQHRCAIFERHGNDGAEMQPTSTFQLNHVCP